MRRSHVEAELEEDKCAAIWKMLWDIQHCPLYEGFLKHQATTPLLTSEQKPSA